MGSDETQRAAYEFLTPHAKAGTTFTEPAILAKTGSKQSSWETYRSKQLREFIERRRADFFVKPEFARLTFDDFRNLMTQVRRSVMEWERSSTTTSSRTSSCCP